MTQTPTDDTAALVRRLARPHTSGGMLIERSVILAEGSKSATILSWISEHGGVPDSVAPAGRNAGLHGSRASAPLRTAPASRFVLPAEAFLSAAES